MDLRNMQQKYGPKDRKGKNEYHGIPIFCASGIHEGIFNAFLQYNRPKDIAICVLGSGPGAFDQRLLDHGYTNITSVEFIAESFMVKGTKFISRDLNQDFTDLGTFDVIFAIELIEHLENQFHFVRNAKAMLKKDAVFYLSTPNVESSFARLKYFLLGRLQWFGPGELIGTGHISPVFNHILQFNLSQSNLVIKKHFANANIWSKLIQHKNIAMKVAYAAFSVVGLFIQDNTEINLFEIIHKD